MDANNISGISIEDNLDESYFSAVSSVGTELKQILEKIKKLETKSTKNKSGSSSMFQICVQFGELKKEVERMKAGKQVDIGAFEELKKKVEKFGQEYEKMEKEFDEKHAEMKEENEKLGQEVKKLADELTQKGQAMDLLKAENQNLGQEVEKLKGDLEGNGRAMDELKGQINELNEENRKMSQELRQILGKKAEKDAVEIAEVKEENDRFKRKIERIETYFPKMKKVLINRRALSAELLNEVFASLPMKNAFDILAKMPNCLLARNMRKMLKSIKMAMRNNKWNEADCGSKIKISGGGLVVKHSGPDGGTFALDFAVCTQQFPLENRVLGDVQNSFGIWSKGGIWIDEKENSFWNEDGFFQAGDVIGIGIVHFQANSTMKCFASCNGNLLGKADLPIKFANLQLFPAVTMYQSNNLIQANFGRDPWQYNPVPEHLAN